MSNGINLRHNFRAAEVFLFGFCLLKVVFTNQLWRSSRRELKIGMIKLQTTEHIYVKWHQFATQCQSSRSFLIWILLGKSCIYPPILEIKLERAENWYDKTSNNRASTCQIASITAWILIGAVSSYDFYAYVTNLVKICEAVS